MCNAVTELKKIPARHLKTGNMYFIVADNVLECTNGREDIPYVVYQNSEGMLFCREREQFWQKFEKINV